MLKYAECADEGRGKYPVGGNGRIEEDIRPSAMVGKRGLVRCFTQCLIEEGKSERKARVRVELESQA